MINYNEYQKALNDKYRSGYYTGVAVGIVIASVSFACMFIIYMLIR